MLLLVLCPSSFPALHRGFRIKIASAASIREDGAGTALRGVFRDGCAAPKDDGKPGLPPRNGASAVARRPAFPLQSAAGASAGTDLRGS